MYLSAAATKKPPAYLREARTKAGCANRVAASMLVPFSPETIGRHERGDVTMEPEDAMLYAEKYRAPGILIRYCADCPIGKATGRDVTDRPLPHAALRIRRMVKEAQQVADQLEEIAFDGVIDDAERDDFARAMSFLRDLEKTISDIILVGINAGIKEDALTPGKG